MLRIGTYWKRGLRSRLAVGACLCAIGAAAGAGDARSTVDSGVSVRTSCDELPTGVAAHDHWLHFKIPPGLMPDAQFDGRPAKLEVHRVRPVYAHGRCDWVPRRAVVLIHGCTIAGPAV